LNDIPSTGGVPLLINPAKHLQLASGASAPARTWTNARVADWQERYEAACRELEGPRGKPGNRRKFAVYRNVAMRPSPVMVWTPEQAGQFLDRRHRSPALPAVPPGCVPGFPPRRDMRAAMA
jgi:hypothetical protein